MSAAGQPGRPTLDEIASMGQAGSQDQRPAAAPVDREHTFMLRVEQLDGTFVEGTCTSRIQGTSRRVEMGRARARLAGGLPWDSLDTSTQWLIDCQVTVAFCIAKEDRPEWLDAILEDREDVLVRVAEEVRRHEQEYFRRLAGPGGSEAGPAMVQVTPLPGAASPPAGFGLDLRGALGGRRAAASGAAGR